MKRLLNVTWIILLFQATEICAQNTLDTLLSLVSENNEAIISARTVYDAELATSRTGLYPGNPEIEYGYLYGSPDVLGNRTDFSVTQIFNFPSVYMRKADIAKSQASMAELKLQTKIREVLLEAEKAFIEAVYLNARISIIGRRTVISEKILEGYNRRFDRGEIGIIEVNQSKLQEAVLRNEFLDLINQSQSNAMIISKLCGGKSFQVTDSIFPASHDIDPDTLLSDYQAGPQLQLYREDIQLKILNRRLQAGYRLPQFSAGYYSESILNERLRGFHAGITIPLWENSGEKKKAGAEVARAESEAGRFTREMQTQIMRLHHEWKYAKDRLSEFSGLFEDITPEVYYKALEAGEISLAEFYYSTDVYYRNRLKLIDYQKDVALKEAELLIIYL